MNPNAPSWGSPQGQNNQQQQQFYQQQYNPYATQQAQAQPPMNPMNPMNPYTAQQAQQQFARPLPQQTQQPQQFQQASPPQQQQRTQQQYNQYVAQQQQQQHLQQQYYYQQQQQQRQQQPFNNQQPQYNNNNNMNQNNNQYQKNYQTQNPNKFQQNHNNTNINKDNWDSPDEQPRPQSSMSYGNVRIQTKQNENELNDKSDEDNHNQTQTQNPPQPQPQNQNQTKKKKKRRRGGRNKNKKENPIQSIDNTPNAQNIDINGITNTLKQMKIEPKPKSKSEAKATEAKKEETAPRIQTKPSPEPSPKPIPSVAKKTEIKNKKKAKKEKEKLTEQKDAKSEGKKKKKSKIKWDAHDPREHINLVLIGHVDAGKSTISGQILLATNQIDERTISKYKKEAKEKNRESWWIAYIMDEDDEERNKGKTVECGRAHFDTDNKRYTILDAPGHKNYVPNMISGAQQADVAILVISARRGEFEAGFDRGGQTREHALLALTLGISRIVIVVNKMDTMQWSKDRYDDIKNRVTAFLFETGFKKKYIDVLPISGQTATNIKTKVTKDICSWYNGNTLIQKLDSLKKVKRATGDVLRIPILDRYKGDKGLQAIGKVEAGILKKGDSVMIMPTEVSAVIIGLAIDDEPVDSVGAGENILITFDKGALSMDQIYGGCVICSLRHPTKIVETFIAEIYIHEIPGGGIMTKGYQAMFHSHNISTLCEIVDIPHKLHKKTRKRSKAPPSFLRGRDSAIVKIKLDKKNALEPFEDCGALGRFTLRDSGKTVVIGKIIQVIASKSRLKNKGTKEYKFDKY